MSEQKHTPGPWKKIENYTYVEISSLKESVLTFLLNRNVPELCQRQLANAELIARAPELLQQVAELRKREKELVEALRARYEHLKWLKDVNTTPPSVIDEINFLQSLLSKFEVPNQS